MERGTKIQLCNCAELTGLKGVVLNTFHDYCTYGHAKWIQVQLENGTTKTLRSCFVTEL